MIIDKDCLKEDIIHSAYIKISTRRDLIVIQRLLDELEIKGFRKDNHDIKSFLKVGHDIGMSSKRDSVNISYSSEGNGIAFWSNKKTTIGFINQFKFGDEILRDQDDADNINEYSFNKGDLVVIDELLVTDTNWGSWWIKKGEIVQLGGRYWSDKELKRLNAGICIMAKSRTSPAGNGAWIEGSDLTPHFTLRHATPEEKEHYRKVGIGANIKDVKEINAECKENFKEGDYIVLLEPKESKHKDRLKIDKFFPINYIFKQKHTHPYLLSELDTKGNNANGWSLYSSKNKEYGNWRYATLSEIASYNDAGKPIDVTKIGSVHSFRYAQFQDEMMRFQKQNLGVAMGIPASMMGEIRHPVTHVGMDLGLNDSFTANWDSGLFDDSKEEVKLKSKVKAKKGIPIPEERKSINVKLKIQKNEKSQILRKTI